MFIQTPFCCQRNSENEALELVIKNSVVPDGWEWYMNYGGNSWKLMKGDWCAAEIMCQNPEAWILTSRNPFSGNVSQENYHSESEFNTVTNIVRDSINLAKAYDVNKSYTQPQDKIIKEKNRPVGMRLDCTDNVCTLIDKQGKVRARFTKSKNEYGYYCWKWKDNMYHDIELAIEDVTDDMKMKLRQRYEKERLKK